MKHCDWCGEFHLVEQLCHARPKWGRRGFLVLFGMGLAGSALPSYTPKTGLFANGQVIGEIGSIAGPSFDLSDLGLRRAPAISFSGTFDRTDLRDGDVFRITLPDGQAWEFPATVEMQGRDGVTLRPIGPPKVTG